MIILIICSLAILLLGLLVYVRNPSLAINRRFGLLSLSLAAWTIANYLSDTATNSVLLYTRLTFFCGVLAMFSLVQFIANFPSDKVFPKSNSLRIHSALSVSLMVIVFTPEFIKSVNTVSAEATITTGHLYSLFLAYAAYSLILICFIVVRQYKNAKLSTQKQQVKTIAAGILLYAVFAMTSNIILPLVSDSWSSSRYGPVFTLFLVGMVGYTIVRHGLFDIRLVVARSLGYLGSLGFMGIVYGLLVLGIAQTVFGLSFTPTELIFLCVAIAIAGLLFQRVQRLFNRMTSRFFYRDSYDSQAFLDAFNKVIVATYELNPLLQKSAEIIAENLKPLYCAFIIKEGGSSAQRLIGTETKSRISDVDLKKLRESAASVKQQIIITDKLDQTHNSLHATLRKNDIAIMARLTTGTSSDGIGYIILGSKKNGSPFNPQDVSIIEIIANELVIAVQNSLRFEEIENFTITLQQRVNEATRKLRRSNEKLKALDEAKDDFVSMASHQLRTPLTSIKGYTSMVLEGDAGKINATQRRLLEQSYFSSQRMVYLIADLLNVSRLKTGKFIIEPVPVNLAEVVSQEIVQLKETAEGRQLELTYDMPKDFPTLMLDETKTRQVIMNFVDNAIYYTPAGGHIQVELVETPASVELRVVDDGIGVPASERPHLFTKFYRAGNARKARPDGTGLGLFMAKKVVAAEGGAVIFETEEGKGSTFGFVFSKSKLAPKTDA